MLEQQRAPPLLGGTVADDYDEPFDPYELALLWNRSAVGIFIGTDERAPSSRAAGDPRRRATIWFGSSA
jgi:hypothetical protein